MPTILPFLSVDSRPGPSRRNTRGDLAGSGGIAPGGHGGAGGEVMLGIARSSVPGWWQALHVSLRSWFRISPVCGGASASAAHMPASIPRWPRPQSGRRPNIPRASACERRAGFPPLEQGQHAPHATRPLVLATPAQQQSIPRCRWAVSALQETHADQLCRGEASQRHHKGSSPAPPSRGLPTTSHQPRRTGRSMDGQARRIRAPSKPSGVTPPTAVPTSSAHAALARAAVNRCTGSDRALQSLRRGRTPIRSQAAAGVLAPAGPIRKLRLQAVRIA